jgi:hypothetical protein
LTCHSSAATSPVEQGRAQVERNAVDGVDGAVDQRIDVVGLFAQHRIGAVQPRRQHGHRHLDGVRLPPSSSWISRAMRVRSCSLTRSVWALSSARRARVAHFLLLQLAVGDVGHDAVPAHRAGRQACGVQRRLIHLTSFQASTQMRPSQFQLHSAVAEACMASR